MGMSFLPESYLLWPED